MEHIVRSIGKGSELADYIESGYDEDADDLGDIVEEAKADDEDKDGYESRASTRGRDDMSDDMEARLVKGVRNSKRFSNMSIVDVADRHLRDKTDAIAHIIRNISEQCAAAVEGLQLAHDAEVEAEELALNESRANRSSNLSVVTANSDDGKGSETGEDSLLHPSRRASSIPPTPDLIHRSSTSMSVSSSATTPERSSQQYNIGTDIPTKIVEGSDEEIEGRSEVEDVIDKSRLIHRPAGARISALGGH